MAVSSLDAADADSLGGTEGTAYTRVLHLLDNLTGKIFDCCPQLTEGSTKPQAWIITLDREALNR